MIFSLKTKLNHSWKFRRNWNVHLGVVGKILMSRIYTAIAKQCWCSNAEFPYTGNLSKKKSLEPSLESPSEIPLYPVKKNTHTKHTQTHPFSKRKTQYNFTQSKTHTHKKKHTQTHLFSKRKTQYIIILLQKCKRRKDPSLKHSLHFLILFSKLFYKRVKDSGTPSC
jgi:hypothetical protein